MLTRPIFCWHCYADILAISANKLANEYDIGSGNLSRIENVVIDCKFITLWKIAEALNISFSELAQCIEKNLKKDFKLIDE